jgi:hypothetical protein
MLDLKIDTLEIAVDLIQFQIERDGAHAHRGLDPVHQVPQFRFLMGRYALGGELGVDVGQVFPGERDEGLDLFCRHVCIPTGGRRICKPIH